MKPKRRYNEKSALASSEKWKILQWLWDNLENCKAVEQVTDVGAAEGTLTLVSQEGEEFTIKIEKGNWRQL